MKPNVFIFSLLLVFTQSFTSAFAQEQAPLTETDTHAQFPGGREAFSQYLAANLEYPMKAREMDLEGNVFARFSVSKDGQISNVIVLKGLKYGCNEEVKRVLEAMPAWIPAKKDGQVADTFVIIPVQFRLTDF